MHRLACAADIVRTSWPEVICACLRFCPCSKLPATCRDATAYDRLQVPSADITVCGPREWAVAVGPPPVNRCMLVLFSAADADSTS